MKSQKYEILRNNEISKKNENSKFSNLKNFRTQSMSMSGNVSVRQCQNPGNVRVR